MRVRILRDDLRFAGHDLNKGDTVDVPEGNAKLWVRWGWADVVTDTRETAVNEARETRTA